MQVSMSGSGLSTLKRNSSAMAARRSVAMREAIS